MFNKDSYNDLQLSYIRWARDNDSIDLGDLDPQKYSAHQMNKVWAGRKGDTSANIDDLDPQLYSVKQMEFISKVRDTSKKHKLKNIDDLDPKKFPVEFMKILSKYRNKKTIETKYFDEIDLERYDKKQFEQLLNCNDDLSKITYWPELKEDVSITTKALTFNESDYTKSQLEIVLKGRRKEKGVENIDDLDPSKFKLSHMKLISNSRYLNEYKYLEGIDPVKVSADHMILIMELRKESEQISLPDIKTESFINHSQDQILAIKLSQSDNPKYGNIDDLDHKKFNAGEMYKEMKARGASNIFEAIKSGKVDSFNWYLENEPETLKSLKNGFSPIHYASQYLPNNNNFFILNKLIELGSDVNQRSEDITGATPLWLSSKVGNKKAIEILLNAGANVNQDISNGEIPLAALGVNGNYDIECVKFLLESGASPDIQACDTGETFRELIDDLIFESSHFDLNKLIEINKLLENIGINSVKVINVRLKTIIPSKFLMDQINIEQFEILSKKYVPKFGQAKTMQGELIRLIGNVFAEYRKNGNLNWDVTFESDANWLRKNLRNKEVFSLSEVNFMEKSIDKIISVGKSGKQNYSENNIYFQKVQGMCVKWCQHYKQPIENLEFKDTSENARIVDAVIEKTKMLNLSKEIIVQSNIENSKLGDEISTEPVKLLDGEGIGLIKINSATHADVVSQYGENFELIIHKKYSIQIKYTIGLSFYYKYHDDEGVIFSIAVRKPFNGETKKNINISTNTLGDVFEKYGKAKKLNAGKYIIYSYPGIDFNFDNENNTLNRIGKKQLNTNIDYISLTFK
ncbi:MAG: ankyrin repeat domain-containing protein [Saccharospirillaceae bacterium]|nr:ankyrin repeat domain-containing protein [Pseudomonadales bacterium]NRB80681.1 ankyrin repeat domain-containing protein [Saccharospirillaceae bacterium]